MPHTPSTDRRNFLKAAAATGVAAPYWAPCWASSAAAQPAGESAPSDRPLLGAIGVGGRGSMIARDAARYGAIVAAADVDSRNVGRFQKSIEERGAAAPEGYKDYRRVLERKDIDAVTIGTPDHWHTKIAIEAMQAGKDVYCEKPLTLTIEEGQLIAKAVRQTGRVFQVGTQQRSDGRFQTAVALAQSGRLGEIKRVWVAIGGGRSGGPFEVAATPATLDWDMWQGQTPDVDYRTNRCHRDFRWWYEYSAGKLTDWGAHHVDIAQWGAGLLDTSAVSVAPLSVNHPVKFKDGYPTAADRYNTATKFRIDCRFAGGVEMRLANAINEPDRGINFGNGVLFEGTKGRVFVNRGKVTGTPVEELKENPLPEDALQVVYKGRKPKQHMADFFDCLKTREEPVSDVFSHHRILSTCHLAALALRFGRSVSWNPETEQVEGDPQVAAMVSRPQRAGYELPKV